VEIGYDVVAAERRNGYARERVHGLAAWAFTTGRARIGVASVSPDNTPSLALLRSLGFRHVGQQIDHVDGFELVFERPFAAGRRTVKHAVSNRYHPAHGHDAPPH
jgi:ribosomal-protein-alanine N-acetyltransferase